ncbi:MAG: formate dehydrogenase accessory sulfurtransferase FdhD [Desulfobacteraceae bacterium]|jgi:FdhD protein
MKPYLPEMTNAGVRPTHTVSVIDETGEAKEVEIAGELPLTILVDGYEIVTLMTLGTHPEQLALGYLRNQRLITELETIKSVRVDWETESVYIETKAGNGGQLQEKLTRRTITTGCAQGTIFSCTIDGLYETQLSPMTLRQSQVARLMKSIAQYNDIYKAAGAVHGCALCSTEAVEIFVEDVGRHNAADTIAGKMWLDRIPGRNKIFYSTGRLTSEIVMKAALMEIPAIISRSGITHMGLNLSQDLGMIMIARLKGVKFFIYNGQEHFIHDL